MRLPIRLVVGLCLFSLLATVPAVAKDATAPPGYDEELRQVWDLLDHKQYPAAITALERLDQLAGEQCGDCLLYLAGAHAGLGHRAEAARAARRAIPLVSDPERLAYAYSSLGFALADKDAGPNQLAEAEAAVRKTLELDGEARFQSWGLHTLGWILFHRQHYDDLVAVGREYLESHPEGPDEALARSLICVGRNLGNIPGPDPEAAKAERVGQSAVTPPQPLYRPSPGYTDGAWEARIEGTLIAQAIIDTEGCVVNSKILRSLDPELDQRVLDTLRYWVFRPSSLEGRPVKVFSSLAVNFKRPPDAP
jgi:tetratricopeptide (TPR) repeat protein